MSVRRLQPSYARHAPSRSATDACSTEACTDVSRTARPQGRVFGLRSSVMSPSPTAHASSAARRRQQVGTGQGRYRARPRRSRHRPRVGRCAPTAAGRYREVGSGQVGTRHGCYQGSECRTVRWLRHRAVFMRPSPDGAGAIMSLCARRAGVLAGRACRRTGLLAGGAARASLARAARAPAEHALWPGCPADTWGRMGLRAWGFRTAIQDPKHTYASEPPSVQ
ncbi:MAG: hypothetical protein ACJA2W_003346 [Planctomycetota bacterium]